MSNYFNILSLAILAVLFSVLYGWWSRNDSPNAHDVDAFIECSPHILRSSVGEFVPTSGWNFDGRYVAEHFRQPVVVRREHQGATFQRWRTEVWSSQYFIQAAREGHIHSEVTMKLSPSPVVKFANLRSERPFVRIKREGANGGTHSDDDVDSPWPILQPFVAPFTQVNVSIHQFFNQLEDPNPPSAFPYFADGLSVLQGLARDFYPIHPICPFDRIELCDMSIWIGRGGVTAYPHYDSSHNIFVQLVGRKKFTLAAPSAARCGLGLFPSLHPFYRQIQRDIMSEDAADTKSFIPRFNIPAGATCCSVELFDVILNPGDILYMPSQYFHRVTSLSTPSFSINSWWSPSTFKHLARVIQQPLPFEDDWTPQMKIFAARLYIQLVYQRMEVQLRASDPSVPTGPFLAIELLTTRYRPLFNQSITQAQCQQSSVLDSPLDVGLSTCRNLPLELITRMIPDKLRPHSSMVADRSAAIKILSAHFIGYVDRVMKLYQDVEHETARLHVQNYVEEVLWYVIQGRVDLLYPYISCCIVPRS